MVRALSKVEDEARRLSEEERARPAVHLLVSLEEEGESADEVEKLWVAEAEQRFEELRTGVVPGIPARHALAQLRAKVSS